VLRELLPAVLHQSLSRISDIELPVMPDLVEDNEVVLVPVEDARQGRPGQFVNGHFSSYGLESQFRGSLTDTKQGYAFCRGKTELAQPGFRDFPAMEITDHLKAGYAALHTVMLEIKRKPSAHFLIIYNLFFSSLPAPMPLYLLVTVLNL
jgi:hypothetical protein